MQTTVPQTSQQFAETMIRSTIEADLLASEHINDTGLFLAHSHAAVNGLIAAMAIENLRRFAPEAADDLAESLHDTITAGDIAGPAYRAAKALGHDPDQWIAEFNERAERRRQKASQR